MLSSMRTALMILLVIGAAVAAIAADAPAKKKRRILTCDPYAETCPACADCSRCRYCTKVDGSLGCSVCRERKRLEAERRVKAGR